MNLVQGDCKCGALAFVAGENLSAATGLLVKLSSAGKAVKPGAASDIAPYVVACGAFEGYLCGVVPLSSAANCRVVLKGACQAGSLLLSAGDGRVEAGALSGTALPVGIAEETGVDGQRVLLRPLCVGARGAAGEAGAAGAPGVAGAAGEAGVAGAPGAAGARGAAEGVGFITEAQVAGTFVGSGQLLFFGPNMNDGVYQWLPDPSLLSFRFMMGLVMDAVDPTATEVVYRLKVLLINGANWRSVSIPRQYVLGVDTGYALWAWFDAVLLDAGPAQHYALMNGTYSGLIGGAGLHAVTAVGDEILCVSEISA